MATEDETSDQEVKRIEAERHVHLLGIATSMQVANWETCMTVAPKIAIDRDSFFRVDDADRAEITRRLVQIACEALARIVMLDDLMSSALDRLEEAGGDLLDPWRAFLQAPRPSPSGQLMCMPELYDAGLRVTSVAGAAASVGQPLRISLVR